MKESENVEVELEEAAYSKFVKKVKSGSNLSFSSLPLLSSQSLSSSLVPNLRHGATTVKRRTKYSRPSTLNMATKV